MKQKILVIGDVMLDHYIRGGASRLSPEAPVPVVHVQEEFHRLGGAANVAKNINELEHPCGVLGFIGQDANGTIFKELLAKQNIENHCVSPSEQTVTTTKTRVIAGHQQVVRIDNEKVLPDTNHQGTDIVNPLVNSFEGNYVVISDYGKGVCSESLMATVLKQGKAKVLIDPKGLNWKKYSGAFLVKPNLKELALIANQSIANTDKAVATVGSKVRAEFGFEHLLVTRGGEGMTLISANAVHHFAVEQIQVFDVSGAGDTVIAVLAVMLNDGNDLNTAVRVANEAGRLVVSRRYTYAITRKELDLIMEK